MQYLSVSDNLTLKQLSNIIGVRNVENTLHINNLSRVPYVGKQFKKLCRDVISSSDTVNWEQKKIILNTMTDNSDVFEAASLLGSSGWKLLNSDQATFPGYIRIPDSVRLSNNINILGNNEKVSQKVYNQVMTSLVESSNHDIDPSIFTSPYYGVVRNYTESSTFSSSGPMRYFRIPFGEVTLYSSLSDSSVDFPCYPEEMDDIRRATYGQMPDMLYQYEPWMVYTGSGPRTNTYSFDIHRDMWDDHNNGMANQLIRFCQANCYPSYNGAAVHASLVTLYISGYPIIHGVVTDVNVHWDGPLGHDKFYLHFKLDITIQEVSETPLNFNTMLEKPLIG